MASSSKYACKDMMSYKSYDKFCEVLTQVLTDALCRIVNGSEIPEYTIL